jgi:hypothetical protein
VDQSSASILLAPPLVPQRTRHVSVHITLPPRCAFVHVPAEQAARENGGGLSRSEGWRGGGGGGEAKLLAGRGRYNRFRVFWLVPPGRVGVEVQEAGAGANLHERSPQVREREVASGYLNMTALSSAANDSGETDEAWVEVWLDTQPPRYEVHLLY